MLTTLKLRSLSLSATAVLAIACGESAHGQASFFEGFDTLSTDPLPSLGPQSLIAQGWEFRIQCAWNTSGQFRKAGPSYSPQAGPDSIKLDGTPFNSADVAHWMILPAIPNQVAGDPIALWVARADLDDLEIRYSPSGGTSTGSSATDVGDYTSVLLSAQPSGPFYEEFTAVAPGPGRIAIRYFGFQHAASSGAFALTDSLSVGVGGGTCNTCNIPLPGPGQTVNWTAAMSPIVVDQDITIDAGGTVIVDPGVSVELRASQTKLHVEGHIEFSPGSTLQQVDSNCWLSIAGPAAEARFLGSTANPISIFGGGPQLEGGIDVDEGGTLRIDHANVNTMIHGATFLFQEKAPTVVLENSTFTGQLGLQDVYLETGTLVVRNCIFVGPTLRTEDVYLSLASVTFDGSKLDTERRHAGQPMNLDHLVGINVTGGAPFKLRGSQHHFGPNNIIQGNLWPVELTGGLTPDSVLPQTGNAENVIRLDGLGIGPTTLPNIGLVYEALDDVGGTHCDILPGTTFSMGPGAAFGPSGGGGGLYEVNLRGTPQQPILFDAKTPGAPWSGLAWFQDGERAVAEWVEIRGADRGVNAKSGSRPLLLNFLLQDNEIGGYGKGQGGNPQFRKSRFINNAIGVTTSQGIAGTGGVGAGNFDVESSTNPCSFEGNTIGVWDQSPQVVSRAGNVWWGSVSGPQTPSNPGGSGDSVVGPVSYLPFETAAPDLNETPPSVRLTEMSPRAVGGSRVILQWDADDNGQIVEYRLEHSPHHGCELYTLFEDNIPGNARSWVVDIPVATTQTSCVGNAAFRIVAIDDTGQEGYDVWDYLVPIPNTVEPSPTITPVSMLARPGENMLFTLGNAGSLSTTQVHIDCEQATYNQGSLQRLLMAPVSTDLARLSVSKTSVLQQGSLQGFSDYFEIRPDPQVTGDFPPSVDLLTPGQGAVFVMGDLVPIRWNATDDLGLRSFEVQASYDGGIGWHVVEKGLAGTDLGFDWQLPSLGDSIDDVRVRVIARDTNFQVTSDGSPRVFMIIGNSPAGSNYCGPAVPNSSGTGAQISALGSAVVMKNDVTLVASGLPQNTIGFFLTSRSQGLVIGPGGSQGNLCLGGAIGRFAAPGQIQSSGADGQIVLSIDLAAVPTPSGLANVIAGETWNFQAWYRDSNPGSTSNFTDAVSVTFR